MGCVFSQGQPKRTLQPVQTTQLPPTDELHGNRAHSTKVIGTEVSVKNTDVKKLDDDNRENYYNYKTRSQHIETPTSLFDLSIIGLKIDVILNSFYV